MLKPHEWHYIRKLTGDDPVIIIAGKYEVSSKCVQMYTILAGTDVFEERIEFLIRPNGDGNNFVQWRSPYFGC